jgi:hypothetical protein
MKELTWGTKWFSPQLKVTITGHSRSAEKTGFFIPELEI